ncbi:PA0069 family radical SAM protein [Paracrocinitomix mangrovi]|uniref:PA0069 family radical SAM protein n=1 Tax=Paracrocinitomix mangrovi TaxID=2862509 RepID=UPI001C8D9BC5|nr:PA0069 family radical SAM protein [Paracrocinitomix mangrovi]UKN03200.1 PA0069 family radical SAM protein [Paracrocinitomix mangrovi]
MNQKKQLKLKGRGAQSTVQNKFNKFHYEADHDLSDFSLEELEQGVKTKYLEVFPKSLVNKVPSKDIYLNWSMNPYQGCEHGCAYCYARTTHEFWGYEPALDFERVIMYKPNAEQLLRKFLDKKSWQVEGIMLSGNTDCYQPAERKFELTRKLLKVLNEYKNPVGIITKNSLIERDIDILSELAKDDLVLVNISITSIDESLRAKLEPRTSSNKNKFKTIEALVKNGIPTQVMIGPVIPGLNDHEIPEILKKAADAGAQWANYIMVRLNGSVGDIFTDWIEKTYPERANKVLNHIKSSNGGVLSNTIDGGRMRGKGSMAKMIQDLFEINRSKLMVKPEFTFNTDLFVRPGQQLNLF